MTPIPKHLLKFPWYPGHLAWMQARGMRIQHTIPGGTIAAQAVFAMDLSREDLRGADLRASNFPKSDFRGAALAGADLEDAFMSGSVFTGASMWGVSLKEARIRGCVFSRVEMPGANLKGCQAQGAKMVNVDLTNSDLTDAFLTDAVLIEADLRGADLSGAWVDGNFCCQGTKIDGAFLDAQGRLRVDADLRVVRATPSRYCPTPCVHDWKISDEDGWHRTCRSCKERERLQSSFGKTADGKPFVILMLE